MKPLRFFFRFTNQQQKGVLALFILVILLQAGYFIINNFTNKTTVTSKEEQEWLALQPEIDALKAAQAKKQFTIYPFNPNFISDYKGYTLGMSVQEIDRLHKFREGNKYVNSAAEFQQVTQVSDSLLAAISPYFKFPDWVIKKQAQQQGNQSFANSYSNKPFAKEEKKVVQLDINEAVEEDLVKVYGIGPAYAKTILRKRAKLGAFVSMEQMNEFEQFSPEAVTGLKKAFYVGTNPTVTKLNVNTASLSQLTYFSYFNRDIAKAIITRRSMQGRLNNVEDLIKINQFPVDKVKIIALYLEF
ncbi:helix-hairpin-helix domain-containing protein [Flavobacterium sp. D11R37]|uniref:helix-hairpin-helix domain-containing protein n=1 Tax=Flavobacterium coralii TaxID=2838017 RepID=UPI001CA798AB|nr:helix-hairpin-helix domain-containing protein [Flavobacterium coralii]MBY8962309.1 helix-hairpin-helix domain-containing protein [Flavobacterium coralii]